MKVATSGRLTAVTVAPKATVGVLNVVVPSAPDTDEPTAMLVVDPKTPAVPMFTALTAPLIVAPDARPVVPAAVELPKMLAVAENVQFDPMV